MRVAVLLFTVLVSHSCHSAGTPTLDVYAASSLTEAFEALARGFRTAHPETKVVLHFAGSQILRLQIEQGAPADVYASANAEHVKALETAQRVGPAQVFAHNTLVVIVPRDRDQITTFAQLPRAQKVVIGTAEAPVGQYARQTLQRAATRFGADFETKVLSHVVSHESNVRLVRAKIALGDADAALVYHTDALAFPGVRSVPIPRDLNVRAAYQMSIVEGADQAQAAREWMAYVSSPEGQGILTTHGFSAP